MEPGLYEKMGTIARQLKQYLQQVGAARTIQEAVSTGTLPVLEAAAFQRKLTKQQAINNDL